MSEIDISKCKYYDNYSHKCYEQKSSCDGYNDCSFYNTCYYKQLQQLKAENEKLKKKLQNASDVLILEMGQKEQYQDEYIIEKIDKKKYKQCLDEIERMINDFCSDCIADCTGQDFCITYKILRKIKEVKGNE